MVVVAGGDAGLVHAVLDAPHPPRRAPQDAEGGARGRRPPRRGSSRTWPVVRAGARCHSTSCALVRRPVASSWRTACARRRWPGPAPPGGRHTTRRTRRRAPSAASGDRAAPVAVVPHTHWDREWYRTFPTFRHALVELLDELLPALEADPATPTSCSTARWPWSTTTWRCDRTRRTGSARLAAAGRLERRPVVHPHGRVPRLRRDDGPQPAAGARPGGRVRRGHGG